MSFLTATKQVQFSKRIKAPQSTVLAFIQQPKNLIDLSPVVTDAVASSDNPSTWMITDKLSVLCIPFTTKYTSTFKLTDNGIDSETRAAAGVVLEDSWLANAVEGDAGSTDVVENVEVKANILLLPFTVSGLQDAHNQMLENLAEKLESGGGSNGQTGDAVTPKADEPAKPPPAANDQVDTSGRP